jgi:hypothetical protein
MKPTSDRSASTFQLFVPLSSPDQRQARESTFGTKARIAAAIETLESRTLLSVSIAATKSQAFDVNPDSSGKGVFTFSRTGSTAQALEVDYTVSSASTASTSRYEPLGTSVTIPAGKKSVALDVHPLFDATPLPTQALVLTLSSSSQYTINSRRASAAIKITDKAPTVSIDTVRAHASEKNPTTTGLVQFVVRRTGSADSSLTVNYSFDPSSTAIGGLDFQPLSGTVVIPRGKSSAPIDVTPIDDHLIAPTRTLTVDLDDGTYFSSEKQSKASLTITDDPTSTIPRGTVVAVTVAANASEATSTPGQFLVTRTGTDTSDLTVDYTVAGTAVAGTDYTALSGSVVIPAGQTTATINLTPTNPSASSAQTVVLNLTGYGSESSTLTSATLTIAAGSGGVVPAGWFNTQWHDRVPISVNVGSTTRTDKPVDYNINFTQALTALGKSGTLNLASIRVVETTADGSTVIDPNVPFQFDQASNFDPTTNAAGDLVFLMTGTTQANTTRYYHVYFDTAATGFTAENVTPLVMTTDNTTDAGSTTVTIATPEATYYLQKDNGGFSSIIDKDGNNWLSFAPDPNSDGQGVYRGLPQAVNNGGFHPGFDFGTTQIVSTGPLKTTLISTMTVDVGDGNGSQTYQMKYEIYPTYVTATMLQAPENYWFVYEGTPGGPASGNGLNPNAYIMQSDGTQTNIQTTFNDPNGVGGGNGQEWLYFEDGTADRYLFMVKDQATSQPDDYESYNGQMTVFGFGRDNSQTGQAAHQLSGENSFTFGLAEGGSDFSAASTQINGTYQPMTTTGGAGQTIS